ncbi:MAG TPA: branched-chain amino acid ABC transporter substrate-binding protein [Jatrophihabitans sp.]|nr:branched-chain amino acid ABC transporter substrate-binding protein [Jatrophihabitans sp.]
MRTLSLAKIAVIGAVGALALSACSNSSSGNSSGLTNGGGGGSSANSSGGTYTIAFQGPLSGDNQQLGINEVNGVQLAIDQANKSGNLGFTLKLLKADDQGDPSKAPAAAAQVLQDNTVVGVIGPSFSGATKAVGKTYGAAGVAMISPSATNPSLSTLGFQTFHRIIPSDNVEGTQAADWLAKKTKKIYVVDDLSDYGKGVADAVQKEAQTKGVTVVRTGVDAKTTDYSAAAAAVKGSGAGALFYGGYDAQAALFAKALNAVGYTGIKIGGNGIKSSVFTKQAGTAGNGWYFSCGCLDATTAPAAKDFAAAYQAAFNTPPSTYSPEAYDATNALIAAMKAAKSKGSITKSSVEDAVNNLDYQGITTEVKFESNGEVVATAQTVNLFTQKDGNIVLIGNIKDQN